MLSLVGALVLTVAVIAGALNITGGGGPEGDTASDRGPETSISESEAHTVPVGSRPDCPSADVAGIALECLGGEAGAENPDRGVTVVNVWAWWCGPCREELPHLQEFADTHPDYTVVGVHADQGASRGADFLSELELDLPSYQDPDNSFAGTLGLPRVIPITVVFVDGEMIDSFPVPFTSAAEIERAVEGALAGIK